jgi:hypothetical protein
MILDALRMRRRQRSWGLMASSEPLEKNFGESLEKSGSFHIPTGFSPSTRGLKSAARNKLRLLNKPT